MHLTEQIKYFHKNYKFIGSFTETIFGKYILLKKYFLRINIIFYEFSA